jgi:hydroxymethylglutaryl-CoA synthase
LNTRPTDPPRGIVSYGVHLPRHLLNQKDIRKALGQGGGAGTRTVAGYDEDANSMGVEAARAAFRGAPRVPGSVSFATTAPGYCDKTNATTIHAALALPSSVFASDHVGSVRGAIGAFRVALADGGLAVMSDIRTGRPGSADEARGGDGAAAFVMGDGDAVVAQVIAQASESVEMLERWRVPGELASSVWEERFAQDIYMDAVSRAVRAALREGGIQMPDHVVVSSLHGRVAKTVAAGFGERAADAFEPKTGHLGTAHWGVRLADILDRAVAGETILLISAVDGADAILLRVTDAISARRPAQVSAQLQQASPVDYATFLTWRGVLQRELPRRPDPVRYDAPPAFRAVPWKFAFRGCRCTQCGRVHLPPQRVCGGCGAVDAMEAVDFADKVGTVVTYSIDHLAYSMAPPVITAVIDFDGGGRYGCEVTDCTAQQMQVGLRVGMSFRKMFSASGVHNYFWKAVPHGE